MVANKVVGFAVLWWVLFCLVSENVYAVNGDMGGGDGSESSPWLIEDLLDFHEFAGDSNYWDDYTRLECDPNLIGITYPTAVIAPYGSIEFTGVFDGNNHVIYNLTIDTAGADVDYLGLFGWTDGYNAEIKNLGLVNVNIIGGDGSEYIGGLCGYNSWSSFNSSIIINCYTTGSIISGENTRFLGGLCGRNNSYISNCYSTCTVICGNGSNYSGGLCGNNISCINNCYATGLVTGDERIGGLCGLNYRGCISNCYSIGSVTGGMGASYVGGFCGLSIGSISNCYYLNTAGPNNGLATPLSNFAMKQQSSFNGWDFLEEATNGTSSTWSIKPETYPELYYFDPNYVLYEFAGQGIESDPYLIYEPNDLGAIWQQPDRHYRLCNDMNLSGINWPVAVIPAFSGVFDGNDHSISNLNISGGNFLGLLGASRMSALITSLGLENVQITGEDYSMILGGLCGINSGYIVNCYATGSVASGDESWYVGGLCGLSIYGGGVSTCYSTVSVTGGESIRHLGGLCNNVVSSIDNCYATGTVTSGDSSESVGGLCGQNYYGGISNSYSTGTVSSGTDSVDLGGLCGTSNSSTFSNCYFLNSAGPDNGLGAPLSDSEMKQQSSFSGWDFIIETTNGTSSSWIINMGQYPTLYHFDPTFIPHTIIGNGTEMEPYLIYDAHDLGALRQQPDRHYQLQNDLDLTGINWSVSVIPSFLGTLDGNHYVISNLNLSGGSYLGLLGILLTDGSVTNLGLENSSVTGGLYSQSVSSLCGWNNYGSISNCYSNGLVNGDGYLGGICGSNHGSISNCYADSSVTGDDSFGGLCGYNIGTISNCYSTGSVTGDDFLGGLCGVNSEGTISTCYATGSVTGNIYVGGLCGGNYQGSISTCYSTVSVTGDEYLGGLCGNSDYEDIMYCYFLNTAGPNNGLGSPLTESQMKQQSSFASWDFVGETGNGSEDYWQMCSDAYDYPRLTWQFINPADFLHPGRVDHYDLFVFTDDWLSINSRCCDIFPPDNPDGIVNLLDYAEFTKHWLIE